MKVNANVEIQHKPENMEQHTERLIRLEELGCNKLAKPYLWEEHCNTHNEGDEAIEQMDK
jgi:hypothetical protein